MTAFFDIRASHPNADSYRDLSPKQIYRIHENEKKRKYNSRVTEIEQGTFTPLVFTTTGGMADECLRVIDILLVDVHRNFPFFCLQTVVYISFVENHQTSKTSFFFKL